LTQRSRTAFATRTRAVRLGRQGRESAAPHAPEIALPCWRMVCRCGP